MNQQTTKFFAFLADKTSHEILLYEQNWVYLVLKSRYDDETDFLYMLDGYNCAMPHAMGHKAEFAGIYSYTRNELYAAPYVLNNLLEQSSVSTATVRSHVQELATQMIHQKVSEGPLTETDEAHTPWKTEEEFLNYYFEKEALDWFYKHEKPRYSFSPNCENLTTAQLVGAINHPEATARDIAESYMEKQSKCINRRVWEVEQLTKRVEELETTPGEHHTRRKIAESIPDSIKTVNVEVLKDGKSMMIKSEASNLCRTGSDSYSEYCFDAPSRRAFEREFGRMAHLYPRDIVRITYARKILYDVNTAFQPATS